MKKTFANPFRRLLAYWIDITLLYAVLVGHLARGMPLLKKRIF